MNYLELYLRLNELSNECLRQEGYKYSVIWYKKDCSCGSADTYCPNHGRTLDLKSRRVFKDYFEVLEETTSEGLYGYVICKLMGDYDVVKHNY